MTFVLDPTALQRRSLELLEVADKDPRKEGERVAAAEAHVRLVVTGAARDKAMRFLDRARSLDPYNASTYFLMGVEAYKTGSLATSIEAFDHAVLLAPNDARVRYHRAYVLLDAAKKTHSTDLADAARDDFEAVLAREPKHVKAALGAIEASVYGKAKRLRESVREVFARVTPTAELVPAITRLLYQAIFAFGVGKAKNVDTQNKKTMSELTDVARAWLPVAQGDALLGGVIAAAAAKCCTPEEICERLPDYARDIPDVRLVRLLVRERLAEVSDPTKRLELFASGMAKIPPLDGIAQDYLQLVHLVAKRAVAEGDLDGARASWRRCLEKDADNPGAVQNLLRLAEHEGAEKDASLLRARLTELVGIYAQFSPRADLVLARASARFRNDYAKGLADLEKRGQVNSKGPDRDDVETQLQKLVRADALGRVALDEIARDRAGTAGIRRLVDETVPDEDVFEAALEILSMPLPTPAPTAYAYYDVAKDAPEDVLAQARDKRREKWLETAANTNLGETLVKHFGALLARAEVETAKLFDPKTRAAYDHATAAVELAELYRRHHETSLDLIRFARDLEGDDTKQRVDLAGKLHRLRSPIIETYLTASERDAPWLDRALADVAYGGILRQGYEAINQAKPEVAVDLAFPYLETARKYFRLQRLYARAILEDGRVELRRAIVLCRTHAQRALDDAQPGDPSEVVAEVKSLAEESDDLLIQRGAAERSRNCLGRGQTQAALMVLWLGLPNAKGTMALNAYPVGLAWSKVEPQGRGLYSWCVAQSLRSNTIDWYNAQHPSSQWELGSMKMNALQVARSAEKWVRYSRAALQNESLPQLFITQIQDALNNLEAALERDRRNLSG